MSRFRIALLALLVATSAAPLAASSAEEPAPFSFATTREGPGWVVVRFVEEAGSFDLRLAATSERPEAFHWHYRIVGDGYASIGGGGSWTSDLARVDAELAGHEVRAESGWGTSHGGAAEEHVAYDCPRCAGNPRAFLALVIVGGEPGAWSLTIDGAQGSVVGATAGSDAWYLRGRDFGGLAGARATSGAAGAHATLVGEHALHAEHALVGWFGRTIASSAAISVETPEGARLCPCGFDGTGAFGHGDAPAGPGDYVFRTSGAGPSGFDDVFLYVADVVLPPAA